MGIPRLNRAGPHSHFDKENAARHRASRPWDNPASLSKLPKVTFEPIRPPPPPPPTAQRFTPLLRSTHENHPPPTNSTPAPMSVSPRRKADYLSSTLSRNPPPISPPKSPSSPPARVSVSDRLKLFESFDASRPDRLSPRALRNSPFKGALDAFAGGTPPTDPLRPSSGGGHSSGTSRESSDRDSLPPPGILPHGLKTRLGNRELKPALRPSAPPPLVGLPIPKLDSNSSQNHKSNEVTERRSIRQVREHTTHRQSIRQPNFSQLDHQDSQDPPRSALPSTRAGEEQVDPPSPPSEHLHPAPLSRLKSNERLPDIPPVDTAPPDDIPLAIDDPDLMPRFSYRHSVRMSRASLAAAAREMDPPRASFRNSTRFGGVDSAKLSFIPKSSSFLDFDDDERLAPADESAGDPQQRQDGKEPSVWAGMSFDDGDSFDTFATLPKGMRKLESVKEDLPPRVHGEGLRPDSEESEQPLFPQMSFSKTSSRAKSSSKRLIEEEEDGTLDVPKRFTHRPGAEGALKELQRASVTAGNEITESLRLMNLNKDQNEPTEAATKEDKVSKVQGDVLLRSRIFRRWNLRYASIVHQKYFGSVLLLFRSDNRGLGGVLSLKSSKMIALADCRVRKVENDRKPGSMYMFELKTLQRTYMFACNDEVGRDFWVKVLGSTAA